MKPNKPDVPRATAWLLGLCLALMGPQIAFADEEKTTGPLEKFTKSDKITLENKAYFRYWYDVQDSAVQGDGEDEPHANSFELWRYYFGVKAQVTPWLKARITADVGADKSQTSAEADDGHTHKTPGDPRYGLFAKYAWFEAKLSDSLFLKAGIIENPYHAFTDKLWGYRYVFKNLGDEEKLWNSADPGVHLRWALPSSLGNLVIGVVNGSGYKKAGDTDDLKNLWLQAWLHPLKPMGGFGERIMIGAYLDYTLASSDNVDKRILYSGLAGYKDDMVTVAYQLIGQQVDAAGADDSISGLGHGAYLRLDTPWKVGVLGRFAMWDVDTSSEANHAKQQFVGGLSYTPVSLLSMAVSGVHTSWSDVDGDPLEEEIKVLLSTQLKF